MTLPTREDGEWVCRLVARNDPLTEAEASQVSAIVRAYVNSDLLTRAEWEAEYGCQEVTLETTEPRYGDVGEVEYLRGLLRTAIGEENAAMEDLKRVEEDPNFATHSGPWAQGPVRRRGVGEAT